MQHLRFASLLAVLASALSVAACGPLFDSGPREEAPPPTSPEPRPNPKPEETPESAEESCFSPTQNLHLVTAWNAPGCSCNVNYSICVDYIGLSCDRGIWAWAPRACQGPGPELPEEEEEVEEEPEPRACEEQLASAHEQVSAAVADANKHCVYDDDCMVVGEDTGCWSGCPGSAVAVDGSASVLDVIDEIDDGICWRFADECSEHYQMTDCGGRTAICVAGLCELY